MLRSAPCFSTDDMRYFFCGLVVAMLGLSVQAQEISLRHALEGGGREALFSLTERFNAAQKGKARVALEDLAEISDKHRLPVMALLDLDDSRDFFGTRPRFKPAHQAAAEVGQRLTRSVFYPLIADAVSDSAGRIEALPLGLSLPALFWNKLQFRQAGLDPEHAPVTWHDVQDAAGALFDKGSRCPLTSSRFAWVHLENVAAQHSEALVNKPGQIQFNNLIGVKHLALLSSWNKSSYFRYFGAGREADAHFLSGECAMLTGEASFYAEARRAGMDFGIGALPYYDDVYAANRARVLPTGASLWLLAGRTKDEYRLAMRFVAFLTQPASQRDWIKATAFLPMTRDAVLALRESGSPPALLQAAELRLSSSVMTARPRGADTLASLHEALSEEMPFVWRDEKPAKLALDQAMQRVNAGRLPEAPKQPAKKPGRL